MRRIGNRTLNTFYRHEHTKWVNINPLVPLAKEFKAQISLWSANILPATSYETSHTEELPSLREQLSRVEPRVGGEVMALPTIPLLHHPRRSVIIRNSGEIIPLIPYRHRHGVQPRDPLRNGVSDTVITGSGLTFVPSWRRLSAPSRGEGAGI